MADRIPGTSARRRKGRQERAVDDLATAIRKRDGQTDKGTAARITAARMLARSMDDIERQDNGGGHTLAMLGRTLRDYLDQLDPPTPTTTTPAGDDPYDAALARILDGAG